MPGAALVPTSQCHDLHPLDWASYLRRSLVLDPVPTTLTLLLVAAHYHAICTHSYRDQLPGGVDPPLESFSAVGTFFHAGSILLLRSCSVFPLPVLCMKAGSHGSSGGTDHHPCVISTPWTNQAQPLEHGAEKAHRAQHSPAEECRVQQKGHPQPQKLAHDVLQAAMHDPFTLAYDVWSYIAAPHEEQGAAEDERRLDGREDPPVQASEGTADPPSVHPQPHRHAWLNTCILHAMGMAGVGLALIPSILSPASCLACSAGMPQHTSAGRRSAWPVLHASVMMFCLSWMLCCAIHYMGGMPKLALCTAMHLVVRVVASFAGTVASCPLPPVASPPAASSTAMACALGLILLFVSQMAADGLVTFTSEEFYMHHAWACCVVAWAARHLILGPAAWVLCIWQRAALLAGDVRGDT